MAAVREVEIDPEGTFKYILVRLQRPGGGEQRDIVRGTAAAEFHNHIFEKVNPEMEKLGYECKCLGGGKIEHNSKDKKIRVFGLSTVRLDTCITNLATKKPEKLSLTSFEAVLLFARLDGGFKVVAKARGYGKADHSVTVEILKKEFTDYEITWSDDKK